VTRPFLYNVSPPPALLTLVLHDALPILQTMPSFVYLIPAIMFFGLGKVSALFATVIYALPPVIRLTNLAHREVPREMIEAALSRSEEHTSELQSRENLVCRLLLEKKKKQ